jgi:hypothetical protein
MKSWMDMWLIVLDICASCRCSHSCLFSALRVVHFQLRIISCCLGCWEIDLFIIPTMFSSLQWNWGFLRVPLLKRDQTERSMLWKYVSGGTICKLLVCTKLNICGLHWHLCNASLMNHATGFCDFRDHAGGNEKMRLQVPRIKVFGGSLDNVKGCTDQVENGTKLSLGKDIEILCLHTPWYAVRYAPFLRLLWHAFHLSVYGIMSALMHSGSRNYVGSTFHSGMFCSK